MGIIPHPVRRDAHLLQHLCRPLQGLAFAAILVKANDLCNLCADGVDGIQRCHGVLKNHRDLCASNQLHFLFRYVKEITALKQDFAVLNLSGLLNQPEHAQRRCGFSCARLPHQAKGGSPGDGKAHVIHCMDVTCLGEI